MVKIHTQAEIAKMSDKDLADLLKKSSAEAKHLSLQLKLNQRKDSHALKNLKKQVARINTVRAAAQNTNPTDTDAK